MISSSTQANGRPAAQLLNLRRQAVDLDAADVTGGSTAVEYLSAGRGPDVIMVPGVLATASERLWN